MNRLAQLKSNEQLNSKNYKKKKYSLVYMNMFSGNMINLFSVKR